jgi:DNA-binding NtrC family response regulator
MEQILVVDDEKEFRTMLARAIGNLGYEVITARDKKSAINTVSINNPIMVFLDMNMGGDSRSGIKTFHKIKNLKPNIPIVFITGYGEIKLAVDVMKLGAFDFLEKPVELSNIRDIIGKISEKNPNPKESVVFGGIESFSPQLIEIVQMFEASAKSDAHLLITGESGTGKEVAAQFIHDNSLRNNGPFIKMNCAAIPPNLMESEVFGVEKGAFTGAVKTKPGRFEAAQGGTLLLDEIGEMDISLQAKLLRVIQEKVYERVGSVKPLKSDARIVATTNINMKTAIEESKFREDLYYRLNVFEVTMPPLRNRQDDIIPLAEQFIKMFSTGIPAKLSKDLEPLLIRYPWPGNIRELRNAMERGTILARGGIISQKHLPPNIQNYKKEPVSLHKDTPTTGAALLDAEKKLIIQTLETHNGNRTHTAKTLGISRRALQYKIKKWEID